MSLYSIIIAALISSSIMVISSINPVHSIIWLVISFVNAATLFVLINLDFMGMILLVVYVGAIAVLFVFVIMLLNISSENNNLDIYNILPAIVLITLSIVTQITLSGKISNNSVLNQDILKPINFSNPKVLASKFYSLFDIYLIIPSLILLVAMVGTIILTLPESFSSKKQQIFVQTTRDKHYL
uniref:NADH-ubiquinone oxidoreductase chain 6 n=1 Tax=Cyanea nozakii TaxID=135523 RepID=A0A343VTM4_CYANO|nr:NADH dehydrogenase subunit 6 [Cyanea nozakii]